MTLPANTLGIKVIQNGQSIEKMLHRGNEVSLHASGNGTEIIHHRLLAGARWALVPPKDEEKFEYIYLISGQMTMKTSEFEVTLRAGDAISALPVQDHCTFIAQVETEFLYVSSHPVFHNYSEVTKKMRDMAVEIEQKDGNTADHCNRITQMSLKVGEAMQLSSQQMLTLQGAAFFHDIGKIRIPDHVLNKPGKLTPDEWEIMKKHASWGREILEETGIPHLVSASLIVEQHHERFDGKGYPRGLAGHEIDLLAAIISVIDSFDAMTYDRVYRDAIPRQEAIEEIVRCRGTMYRPDVVDVFLRIVDEL